MGKRLRKIQTKSKFVFKIAKGLGKVFMVGGAIAVKGGKRAIEYAKQRKIQNQTNARQKISDNATEYARKKAYDMHMQKAKKAMKNG